MESSESEDENTFECEICDKRFYFNTELKQHHALKHSRNRKKPFHQCGYCEKSFHFISMLRRHIDKVHGDTESDENVQLDQNHNQNIEIMHQIPEFNQVEEPGFQFETKYGLEGSNSDPTSFECDKEEQELQDSKCNKALEVNDEIPESNPVEETNFQLEYDIEEQELEHLECNEFPEVNDAIPESNPVEETNTIYTPIEYDIEDQELEYSEWYETQEFIDQIPESNQVEETNTIYTPIEYEEQALEHSEWNENLEIIDQIPESNATIYTPIDCDIEELKHSKWNQNLQVIQYQIPGSNQVEESPNFQFEYQVDCISNSNDEKTTNECDLAIEHLKPKQNMEVSHQIEESNQTENEEEEINFKCNRCGKMFALSSSLRIHKDLYHSIFKCNQCNKQFGLKSSLKLHQENHDNIKIFKCDLCEKQYGLSSSLKLHKKSHNLLRK